jgi:hypothetical protein
MRRDLLATVRDLHELGHRTRRFSPLDPEGVYNIEAMRGLLAVRELLRGPLQTLVMFRSVPDAGRMEPSQPDLSGLYRDRFDIGGPSDTFALRVLAIPVTTFCDACTGRVRPAEYQVEASSGRTTRRCHECVSSLVAPMVRVGEA